MNESETRAEPIDPKLKVCGWGVVEGAKVLHFLKIICQQSAALRAETQKLGAVYQKKIDDFEETKKSILQKAFAGELRCGEPVEPKTEKSRRDDKIIENKMNQTQPNPEGVI